MKDEAKAKENAIKAADKWLDDALDLVKTGVNFLNNQPVEVATEKQKKDAWLVLGRRKNKYANPCSSAPHGRARPPSRGWTR